MIMQRVLDTAGYIEQLHGLASGGCGQNSEND